MKKLLLTLCITVCATSFLHAQGALVFQNNSASAITNVSTGLRAVVATRVGLYVNPNSAATTETAGWVAAGGFANLAAAGIINAGTRLLTNNGANIPGGSPVAVQVRAWLTAGAFTTYESALLGAAAGDHFGLSPVFVMTPAVSPAPAPNINTVLQPFTIAPIPEPSSIALGLLGLGAIALFRRRK